MDHDKRRMIEEKQAEKILFISSYTSWNNQKYIEEMKNNSMKVTNLDYETKPEIYGFIFNYGEIYILKWIKEIVMVKSRMQ